MHTSGRLLTVKVNFSYDTCRLGGDLVSTSRLSVLNDGLEFPAIYDSSNACTRVIGPLYSPKVPREDSSDEDEDDPGKFAANVAVAVLNKELADKAVFEQAKAHAIPLSS